METKAHADSRAPRMKLPTPVSSGQTPLKLQEKGDNVNRIMRRKQELGGSHPPSPGLRRPPWSHHALVAPLPEALWPCRGHLLLRPASAQWPPSPGHPQGSPRTPTIPSCSLVVFAMLLGASAWMDERAWMNCPLGPSQPFPRLPARRGCWRILDDPSLPTLQALGYRDAAHARPHKAPVWWHPEKSAEHICRCPPHRFPAPASHRQHCS